ncbi:MAG: hypothetical protein KJ007_13470, partial [Burkholderiales bacterium]|nr:hypothetical protein [Burkholderiales bacterium]
KLDGKTDRYWVKTGWKSTPVRNDRTNPFLATSFSIPRSSAPAGLSLEIAGNALANGESGLVIDSTTSGLLALMT